MYKLVDCNIYDYIQKALICFPTSANEYMFYSIHRSNLVRVYSSNSLCSESSAGCSIGYYSDSSAGWWVRSIYVSTSESEDFLGSTVWTGSTGCIVWTGSTRYSFVL